MNEKETERELILLQSLYEDCRRLLRYDGVDISKFFSSLSDIEDRVEKLKQLYAYGLDDEDTSS